MTSQSTARQAKAVKYLPPLKNKRLQLTFNISWRAHKNTAGPDSRFPSSTTFAIPIPINANSTVHTTGNTQAGGVSHGFISVGYTCCTLFRISSPVSPPAARLINGNKRYAVLFFKGSVSLLFQKAFCRL